MNRAKNERYQETDKKICDYVLSQIENRPLRDITVSEICKALSLNRSSFYLHYHDVYDVADAISEREMASLNDAFMEVRLLSGSFDPMAYLLAMLRLMQERSGFYRAYLSAEGARRLRISSDKLLREVIIPHSVKTGVSEWEAEMRFSFARAGIYSVCRRWLSGGCHQSPEEVVAVIRNCINMDGI